MRRKNHGGVGAVVQRVNMTGASSLILVCEHASHVIPDSLDHLGLPPEHRQSHAAWDPGAMAVAQHLSDHFDAALIAGSVSRLVYDCNRPPDANDAMPAQSELVVVPGNAHLSAKDRAARVKTYYEPFRAAVAAKISGTKDPVIVTVHSFTPVYHGQSRRVEIGVLHDKDSRLADAMLDVAGAHTVANVQRNQPYGPGDGVLHTLHEHALPQGHLNVMLEIRNDLIATGPAQRSMAAMLAGWLSDAFSKVDPERQLSCSA